MYMKFDKHTIIYCGREYKLRHIATGVPGEGGYFHGDYTDDIKKPWEEFSGFIERVAHNEWQKWEKNRA